MPQVRLGYIDEGVKILDVVVKFLDVALVPIVCQPVRKALPTMVDRHDCVAFAAIQPEIVVEL